MSGPADPPPLGGEGTRYERGRRIATGGMGEVWQATDRVLGREVAVKVLRQEFADDQGFRDRFEAEARNAASLHHPHIASIFDFGGLEPGRTPYLVMELVEGRPLSDLLANGRELDPEQVRLLAVQTADALGAAHAAGVVHRDVKPANLMVTPAGQVKVTDFGIARAIGAASFTQTGQIIGTPHYLAPEQAEGRPATAASDVYALGVVLFECLSGHRPFTGETPIATALAHLQQDVPPLPGSVPPPLAHVVRRAMAKDPAQRYADGRELARALRDVAVGPGAVAPAAGDAGATQVLAPVAAGVPLASTRVVDAPADPRAPRRRTPWPLYAGAAVVLLLLAGLLLAHPWTDDTTDQGRTTSQAPRTSSTPSAATPSATPTRSAEPTTVTVRRSDYVGRSADAVRSDLRGLGLGSVSRTVENPGGQEAGTVSDLSPTGAVEKGSTITLQVWGEAPTPTATPTPPTPSSTPTATDPVAPGKGGGRLKGHGHDKGTKGD